MSRSATVVTIVASLCLCLIASPNAQQAPSTLSIAPLAAIARDRGTVDVIVQLAERLEPEHTLTAPDANAQRDRLRAAQDTIVAEVPGIVASSVKRFETISAIAMTVDFAGLTALAARKDVISIVEDALAQTSLVESVPLIGAPIVHGLGYDGTGWTVAIIDDGFQTDHPMLNGKVVAEGCYSSSDPANSRCPGGASQSTAPGSSNVCAVADCKHGTHVAGTAAGRSVSGGGATMSGVAKNASLITISVFNKTGGASTSNIVLGLERVYELRNQFRIAAVNMSLQAGRYFSAAECDQQNPQYKQAIDNLRGVGIATVSSSGNSGWKDSMAAPSCVSTAVSIGNTTKNDVIWDTSNQASWQSLLAPGTNILASWPGSTYGQMTGTSMASPHVAGAWALLKQRSGGAASVTQGVNAFRSTGVPIQDVTGIVYPRIRVNIGMSLFPSVSAIPNQSVSPGQAMEAPVTINDAQQGPDALQFQLFSTNVNLTPQYQVLGSGSQRTLRVTTAAGMSGTAQIAFIVSDGNFQSQTQFQLSAGAAGPPGPPANFTATLAGGTLSLAWGAPATGAPPTEYVLQVAVDPGFGNVIHTLPTGSAATSMAIPGVPPTVQFYLRILASNSFGTSGPSNSQQIGGPPGAPSGFAATLTGSTLTLTWQAPASGGAPSDYVLEVALDPGFGQVIFGGGIGTNRSATFTGVPPGIFHLRVRARNGSGISAPSNSQQIGAGGCAPPAAPATFAITKLGGLAIRLSWTPAGGATGYTLHGALDPNFASVIATVPVGAATSLDVGAVPGTFFVRVSATNSCGASGPSNGASVTLP